MARAQNTKRQRRSKQQTLQTEAFSQINGMETREQRDAIAPGFYSWLMNIQPIGTRTLRFLNGKGGDIYTAPGGKTILWYNTNIIASTYYATVFLNDGTADQVRLSDGNVTHISATPGTFWNGTGAYPHYVAFGNSGILIISPLGYWAWDGVTLYAAGAAAPSWLTGTSGSFTVTGTATNGSATVTNASSTAALTPGLVATGVAGFAAGDYVGNGTITATSFQLLTLAGAPDPFTGTTGTYTFNFSPLNLIAGAVNGSNVITFPFGSVPTGIVIGMLAAATGFAGGTQITSVPASNELGLSNNFTGSTGNIAFVFSWAMPTGISGTAIEIYNSIPWLVNGRTIQASAPGNGADFATSDGAVSITVKDSYVQDGYSGLKQLDGFLYLFAHGAVDVISDVQTSGTPPTTTFLRVNVSPLIGSPWRDTIVQLPASIAFSNPTGSFEVSGGQARKVSDPFDGIFEQATYPVAASDPSGYHPSAAIITLSEAICYALTMVLADPDTGTSIDCLGMWDGRRWFLSTQETQPIICAGQDNDSNLIGWGSDGTKLFQMFKTPSSTLSKKAKSWYAEGESGITMRKQLKRAYAQIASPFGPFNPQFNFQFEHLVLPIVIDTDMMQAVASITLGPPGIPGNAPLILAGNIPGVICCMFGLTITSTIQTVDIINFTVGYTDYGRWQ